MEADNIEGQGMIWSIASLEKEVENEIFNHV